MFYTNGWGDEADTLEEIERKTLAHMSEEDLIGKLAMTEDSDAIIHWALHQPEFREKFKHLIQEAEKDWIDWQGDIYEEEEEEEE